MHNTIVSNALVNQSELALQKFTQAETLLSESNQRIDQQLVSLQNQTAVLNGKINTSEIKLEQLTASQKERVEAKRRHISLIKLELSQEIGKTQELEKERETLHSQALALQQRVDFLKSPAGIDHIVISYYNGTAI